jgi:hypothetical protein
VNTTVTASVDTVAQGNDSGNTSFTTTSGYTTPSSFN